MIKLSVQIISNLFQPDELAGAALFTDLAHGIVLAGASVSVTTTFSYYPAWALRAEDKGTLFRREQRSGVNVTRVRMYIPRRPGGLGRLLSDFSFLVSLTLAGRGPNRPDVILTAAPMLSQCLVQRWLYGGAEIPKLIVVQDFVVDAALELGILRLPGLSLMLHAVERWALRSANVLTSISGGMVEKLRAKVGSDRRILLIPNWIHGSLALAAERLRKQSLPRERTTLFYSGNLGVKQGLPDFIETFAALQTGWTLTINGGGAEARLLQERCAGVAGITLGGVLDEDAYLRRMLTATACLITQRPNVGANFLPSKVLPALATGTPVLAVCDRASPLGREVEEGGFGEVITPGNSAALKAVLERWAQQPELLKQYSQNASKRAEYFSRERILPLYLRELERLAKAGRGVTI